MFPSRFPFVVHILDICEQVKGLSWSYILSFALEALFYSWSIEPSWLNSIPPTNHLHNSRSPSPGNCFVASKHHLARRTDPVLHSGKSPVPCVTWWINPSSSQTFLPVLGVPRWCKANPPAKAAKASPTENRFCIVLLLCLTLRLSCDADCLGSKCKELGISLAWRVRSCTPLKARCVFFLNIQLGPLFTWWPHLPSKLHPNFHSISSHYYNFQIIVIPFQGA